MCLTVRFGFWNVSDHPSPVNVYLLPVTWAKRALEHLEADIGADQLKARVSFDVLHQSVKCIGFDAILTGKAINNGYDAVERQGHTGSKSVALIVTWEEGQLSLWIIRTVRRGGCHVILPPFFKGRAEDVKPCSRTETMMEKAISMFMAGKLPGTERADKKSENSPSVA